MRHFFRNPLLIICILLWVGNYSLQATGYSGNGFLNYYFNDLLCMPLVLGAAIFIQRYVILQQPDYTLDKWQITAVTIYFAVLFEGIFPLFMRRYTADFLDVAAYCSSSWLFYKYGNYSEEKLIRKA